MSKAVKEFQDSLMADKVARRAQVITAASFENKDADAAEDLSSKAREEAEELASQITNLQYSEAIKSLQGLERTLGRIRDHLVKLV